MRYKAMLSDILIRQAKANANTVIRNIDMANTNIERELFINPRSNEQSILDKPQVCTDGACVCDWKPLKAVKV